MIVITATSDYGAFNTHYDDEDAALAFEQYLEVESLGWENTRWLYIPNLTTQNYYLKRFNPLPKKGDK